MCQNSIYESEKHITFAEFYFIFLSVTINLSCRKKLERCAVVPGLIYTKLRSNLFYANADQ